MAYSGLMMYNNWRRSPFPSSSSTSINYREFEMRGIVCDQRRTPHLIIVIHNTVEFDNIGMFELRHDGCLLEQFPPTLWSLLFS